MQKLAVFLATASMAVSLFTFFQSRTTPALAAPRINLDKWQAERAFPPLIFNSRATLECDISSTKPGRQVLHTVSGQGFEFDMPMLAINDGSVELKKPGMMYKFTAFPKNQVAAEFKGIGKGRITQMKAEVEVDVKRFRQPAGPGTEIRFDAAEINGDAAYVEFTGLFVRASDGKRFPFRLLFGSVTDGSGSVFPSSPLDKSPIMSKMVILGSNRAPAGVTTAMYEAEDDVKDLK